MSESLPASFYRAESAWLSPPEYGDNAEEEYEDRVKSAHSRLKDLVDSLSFDVNDIDDIEAALEAIREAEQDFKLLFEEAEEYHEQIGKEPNPDQEWDERGLYE